MRLAIGSAQFGLDYGISNTQGKTTRDEVVRILELAAHEGITVLDTAALYGTSEEVLGDCLPVSHGFKIVTKTPYFRKMQITPKDALHLDSVFTNSLLKLGQRQIYGLLAHHANDLLAEGGERLMDVMLELKSKGQVAKVGVSVYDGDQIDRILDKYDIDLIQVPINVLDQRLLVSGKLTMLKNAGVEVHARSLFLQGMLLMSLERVPNYFASVKQHLQDYQTFLLDNQLSPIQGALAFASSCKEIDEAILGVCSSEELSGILDAWHSLPQKTYDFSIFTCWDERMINPALWPKAL